MLIRYLSFWGVQLDEVFSLVEETGVVVFDEGGGTGFFLALDFGLAVLEVEL